MFIVPGSLNLAGPLSDSPSTQHCLPEAPGSKKREQRHSPPSKACEVLGMKCPPLSLPCSSPHAPQVEFLGLITFLQCTGTKAALGETGAWEGDRVSYCALMETGSHFFSLSQAREQILKALRVPFSGVLTRRGELRWLRLRVFSVSGLPCWGAGPLLLDAKEAVSRPLTRPEEQGALISEILRTAALSKSLKASPTPNPHATSPRSSGDRKISNCQSPAAHPPAEDKPHSGIPCTDATCCLGGGPRPPAEFHRHHCVAPTFQRSSMCHSCARQTRAGSKRVPYSGARTGTPCSALPVCPGLRLKGLDRKGHI